MSLDLETPPPDRAKLTAMLPLLVDALKRRQAPAWLEEWAFDLDRLQDVIDDPALCDLFARIHATARQPGDVLRLVEQRRHKFGPATRDMAIIGHAVMRQRNYHFAADCLTEAARNGACGPFDLLVQAGAMRQQGKLHRALEVLEQRTKKHGFDSDGLFEQAIILLLLRNQEGALDACQRLSKRFEFDKPSDAQAFRWFQTYLFGVLGIDRSPFKLPAQALMPRSRNTPSVATADVVLGILDYKGPDFLKSSMNIGDVMQSVAVLRQLSRRWSQAWQLSDPNLAPAMKTLSGTWSPIERVPSERSVGLQVLDRDFSWPQLQAFATRTVWVIYYGWYLHKHFNHQSVLPAPEHVRPLFVSFYLQRGDDLTPEVRDYLRRHEPIGCRDWPTTFLLMNQGVRAFFSGCVTTTLRWPRAKVRQGSVFVDHPAPDGAADTQLVEHNIPRFRTMSFSESVDHCLELLDLYSASERIVTSRLHCYLPCRAIDAAIEFAPKQSSDRRFDGLHPLSADRFDEIRSTLQRLLSTIIDHIVDGADDAMVYHRWREGTAGLVAEAEKHYRRNPGPLFDLPPLTAKPNYRNRLTEIKPESPYPERVVIALAFDANLLTQVPMLLRSIRANTNAQLEFVMLLRGVPEARLSGIRAVIPDSEIRAFHMDQHLQGIQIGLAAATTVSTMDRLFLPELLPDIDRLVYLDIDTIVLGDVAELAAFTPSERGIAARPTPNFHWNQQFSPVERRSHDFSPGEAHEYRRRGALTLDLCSLYFNAGVLVLSLATLRRLEFTRQAVAVVEQFGLEDQETMNLFCSGVYTPLPARWNANPRLETVSEPALIHWAGAAKPWIKSRHVLLSHHWRRYAEDHST